MHDIDTILDRIRRGLAKHGRKKAVSLETGIHQASLTNVDHPDWNPRAETIRLLDAALTKLYPVEAPATQHPSE